MNATTRLLGAATSAPPHAVTDTALLAARVGAGAIWIAHGYGDVFGAGVSTNVENYRGAGIPLPAVAAPFAAYVQLVGGLALLVGALVRPVAVGLVVVMGGALAWVHPGEPLVMGQDGSGSGFAFAMFTLAVLLAVAGGGRWSLDHLLGRRIAPSDRQPVGTH